MKNNAPQPSPQPLLVVVTGPTASGKTELALRLAGHFGCDIISADSRQIYRDIPIGTAAPTPEERRRAVHHFVGFLGLDEYYSAARFESDVMALLPSLWARNPVAVMFGGSMMYVEAVVRGIDDMPTVDERTRAYVASLYAEHGLEGVGAQLEILDPEAYGRIDRRNPRRMLHALEVCLQSGKPYSSFCTGEVRQRDFRSVTLAIDRPRDELFGRINRRVERMLAGGMIEEARAAFACADGLNSLNTVGYKELRRYFDGEWDLPTAAARMAKNTRVYAKKQLTWLRRNPEVHWLDPAASDIFGQALSIIESCR